MSYRLYEGSLFSHSILDSWSHGAAGVMRDVCSRWTKLEITQVGSLIAIAGTIPTAGRFLSRVWTEAYALIRKFFLASVTIPGGDPLNRSVVKWILANRPTHYRSFTGRTDAKKSTSDRGAALKKTRHAVKYSPHWSMKCFFFEGSLFIVTQASGGYIGPRSDPAYDDLGGQNLTVACLGWSVEPAKRLINACREHAEKQTQFFVIIYSRDRYGMAWKPKGRTPIRQLDTVHFDCQQKKELLGDIRKYLSPRTQRRYQNRSMPYRRGYLFYGPPGTGKSSLSIAIAGEFGLDLYEVKIPQVSSDEDLEVMFRELPPRCVVLLEDIDAVWAERDAVKRVTTTGRPMRPSSCTLSGILNVLDGVGSQEGRIVIMTTNRPEQLDSALIRPGRIDMRVFLGNISPSSAKEMFIRMFSADTGCVSDSDVNGEQLEELAVKFKKHIPEDTFTPSQLQGFFQLYLDSPYDAADSINGWVESELSKRDGHDFLLVNEKERIGALPGMDSSAPAGNAGVECTSV